MTKGGGISGRNEFQGKKVVEPGQDPIRNKKKMKKNMQRLGGRGGLSLEAFANAKTRNNSYNPSIIKKQREFYKNAKYVQKYKRTLKQQEQQNGPSISQNQSEDQKESGKGGFVNKNKKSQKNTRSLNALYEKKREEEEKARMEREAMIQANKEERQQAEARRRALKEKMYKKTRSGQPVMKYRIEHLLETLQGSQS